MAAVSVGEIEATLRLRDEMSKELVRVTKSIKDAGTEFEKAFKGSKQSVKELQESTVAYFKSFQGSKVINEAAAMTAAVERVGGVTKLTAAEQARLNANLAEAIAKYAALGQKAPAEVTALYEATKKAATGTDSLGTSLGKSTSVAGSFGSALGKVGPLLALGGISIGVSGLVGFAKSAAAAAGEIVDLSKKTGLSTTAVQQFGFVASQNGGTIDQVADAVFKLGVNLDRGTESAKAGLSKLNLEFDRMRGLKPEQQFDAIARALAAVESPQERNRIGVELMGRSYANIAPLIDDYIELMEKAPVASEKAVRASDDAADAIERSWGRIKAAVINSVGGILAAMDDYDRRMEKVAKQAGSQSHALPNPFAPSVGGQRAVLQQAEDIKQVTAATASAAVAVKSYTERLADARKELSALTPAQRAQIDAALKLGVSMEEAADGFLKSADAQALYGATTKTTVEGEKHADKTRQLIQREQIERAGALLDVMENQRQVSQRINDMFAREWLESRKKILDGEKKFQESLQKFTAMSMSSTGNRGIQSALSYLQKIDLKAPDPSKLLQFGKDLSSNILSAIKGGGNVGEAAGSFVGQSMGVKLAEGLAKKTSGFFTSGLGKIIGSAMPVIGSFLGPLAGMLTDKLVSIFTGGEGGKANKLRDSLKSQIASAVAGLENDPAIREALDRFNRAGSQKNVQKAFDDAKRAADEARSVMQKYGLSLDDVKSAGERLSASSKLLAADFQRLQGLGFSVEQVTKAGAAQLNQLIIAAVGAGQKLPAALQPYLQKLIEAGLLTDEAARKMMGLADPAPWRDMQAAAEKYGISVDALGKQFEQSRLDDAFREIAKDFELLTKNGADVGAVMAGMTDEVKELVKQALKAGVTIPESMKPLIEAMAKNGELIDENGNKFDDLSRLTWAKDVASDVDKLIAKLDELIEKLGSGMVNAANQAARALQGATPGFAPDLTNPGEQGTPGQAPGFARGTGGQFLDFGRGMLAMLHGKEMIVPKPTGSAARMTMPAASGGSATVINLNVDATNSYFGDRRGLQDLASMLIPHIPGAATVYVNR